MSILITGATSGIGRAAALNLLKKGHDVVCHGRTAADLKGLVSEVATRPTSGSLHTVAADFSSLRDVRDMTLEVQDRFPNLQCLVNNAGLVAPTFNTTTDGFELCWGVNHLATTALTMGLLNQLAASEDGRVVTLTSRAHEYYGCDTWNTGSKLSSVALGERNSASQTPYQRYSLSKLGNMFLTRYLDHLRRHQGVRISANAIHPGTVQSTTYEAFRDCQKDVTDLPMDPVAVPVGIIESLAVGDVGQLTSGGYFAPEGRGEANPILDNPQELQTFMATTFADIEESRSVSFTATASNSSAPISQSP